jgi:Ca2+-binding EF-hand superfamily protein
VCAGLEDAVRAGGVVAALLLWELQQQLDHLQPLARAFRAADASGSGALGLREFRVFAARLNDGLTAHEVDVLFAQELDSQGHGYVTFSSVCAALLPSLAAA